MLYEPTFMTWNESFKLQAATEVVAWNWVAAAFGQAMDLSHVENEASLAPWENQKVYTEQLASWI